MTENELNKWCEKNGAELLLPRKYFNGITYLFARLKDNWIGIFQQDERNFTWEPLIQAQDMGHAESYCTMREPVTVPLKQIC